MKKQLMLFAALLLIAGLVSAQPGQRRIIQPKEELQTPVRPGQQPGLVKKKTDGAGPVLLSLHNPAYVKQLNVHQGNANKLFAYTKSFTYPDNSKLHVSLRTNPGFAGQPTQVLPATKDVTSKTDSGLTCTTATVSLTATSTDFMNNNYAAQTPHIYPGAIYSYDHLYDGTFAEETAPRNPIVIGSDNPNINGDIFDSVTVPTKFNIENSIARLYRKATGPAANESTSYQIFESSNSSDLNLKVGVSGSGYGASFSNLFGTQNQEQHLYLTIDARKTLFSISTSVPAAGYFKSVPANNNSLVVMGSVSYGVRILANIDYTFKSKSDMDAFRASYSGYGVTGGVNFDLLSSSTSSATTVNAYVVGGPSSETKVSFCINELEQQVQSILAGTNYQNAQPVSYELFDMSGRVIGEQSATDQFVVNHCEPTGQLDFAHVDIRTGDDDKDRDTHFTLGLFTNNNALAAGYSNNSNNDIYDNNTSRGQDLQVYAATVSGGIIPKPVIFTQNDFSGKGGRVHLSITPVGNDTWRISDLTLTIHFGAESHTMQWNTIVLSQNSREIDLFFDDTFKALQ